MEFTLTGSIIVLVVLVFFFIGYKMGLIKAVFDLLSLFATTILTWLLYPWFTSFLMKTPLHGMVYDWVKNWMQQNANSNISLENLFTGLPGFIIKPMTDAKETAVNGMVNSLTDAITTLAVTAISIILLLIIMRILTMSIKGIANFVNKIVIVGPINRFLGGIFGMIQGILLTYVIILLISYFPTTKVYERVKEDIKVSYIGRIMYNENVKFFNTSPRYPL